MIEKCKALLHKYRETVMYLIFGVATTVVSFALYYALLFLGMHYLVAQTLSWIGAVIFAYITNKIWVFESKVRGFLPLVKEFASFVLSRLFSFGVETFLIWLMVDMCWINLNLFLIIMHFMVKVLKILLLHLKTPAMLLSIPDYLN